MSSKNGQSTHASHHRQTRKCGVGHKVAGYKCCRAQNRRTRRVRGLFCSNLELTEHYIVWHNFLFLDCRRRSSLFLSPRARYCYHSISAFFPLIFGYYVLYRNFSEKSFHGLSLNGRVCARNIEKGIGFFRAILDQGGVRF